MTFNKTLIALALASTLGACGSGSSNSSGSTTTSDKAVVEETITPVETTVAGQAVKGVLANAKVTVYKFDDSGKAIALDTATEIKGGEITTDDKGNYSFIVLNYEGPIKIELSPSTDPNNPTTMICDAPAGCGSTAFGAAIDLTAADPDFKLAAISVVDSTGAAKVNVSALTHLAAELIEADGGAVTADIITKQSLNIGAQFGITGDITQLEAAVTTDTTDLLDSNENERNLGFVNAGIMGAIFSNEAGTTGVLSKKFASIVTDLVASKGILLPNDKADDDDSFELILNDVRQRATNATQAAITLITEDKTLTVDTTNILKDLNLEVVKSEAKKIILDNRDDGRAPVIVEQQTDGDAVAKAKAMVSDIRLFAHLFDDTTVQGKDIASQGDTYLALMDDASVMIEAEEDSFELLANISNILADLSMQYDNETLSPEIAALGVDISGLIDGVTGLITFNENTATGGLLFNVNAISGDGDEVVTLNASAEFSADSKNIILSLDGSIESAGAKFTLSTGSFAQVNLDSVVSRTALEEDTFEGEIISGELKLNLTLEQKTTAAIPATDTTEAVEAVDNPITFTGMLHTKLLPVSERVLTNELDTYRPEIDTNMLPEMLSFSGAFSSLSGDLISAMLTVDINNLDGHETPDFKLIGKKIPNAFTRVTSDDLNTIVSTAGTPVEDGFEITRIFVPGDEAGNFSYTETLIPFDVTTHPVGDSLVRKTVSSTFTVDGLDQKGFIYGYSTFKKSDVTDFGAISFKFTPVDTDDNGTTDHFAVRIMGTLDEVEPRSAYTPGAILNDKGEMLFVDADDNNNIKVRDFDEKDIIPAFTSVEDVMNDSRFGQFLTVSPLETSNAAEFHASTIKNKFHYQIPVTITDEGEAAIFLDDDKLEAIRTGKSKNSTATAYITQALIKDALTMEVSADANSVTAIMGDYNRVITFSMNGEAGNFESLDLLTGPNLTTEKIVGSTTENSGLDYPKVSLNVSIANTYHNNDRQVNARIIEITPVDDNEDDKADYVTITVLTGDYFNEGVLVNPADSPSLIGNYSYDTESNYLHILELLAYNPLTLGSALELAKARISAEDNIKRSRADGIGQLEVEFSADDLDSIVAGSTTMFDALNTSPDSTHILEDEEAFLKGNAALTLEAIFGDYQVKVQLSGEKTALEDGKFDLDMSYRLPGGTTQRSFTAHYNSEVEGRLTANNADGVTLVLNESDDDAKGTQVLGQIVVGSTGIIAATIEDRNGVIWIVYADIDGDGLQEEESL